jgi:hypothetical protein
VSAAALAAVAVVVLSFFLSVYVRRDIPVPLGWDTSRYLWQTSFVQAEGLEALREPLPPPYKKSLSRPAFPIIAATTSSMTGVSSFRVAAVLPSVLALVIGAAAGAFVTATLRRPLWELGAIAVAVGTCAYVVRLAAPEAYQDNMSAAAIVLAAAVPITFAVAGVRGMLVPAIVLLGAGAVTHWVFFLFFAGVLGLAGLGLLPGSWRQWRSGRPLWETPLARLSAITIGGGALGAAAIFGVLGAAPERPKFSYPEFRKKLRLDIPKYRFAVALPLAAVGAASLFLDRVFGRASDAEGSAREDERAATRRFVAILLVAWVAFAALGVAAFLAGRLLPAHRFLAFALAVPLLGILGVLAIGRLVAGRPGAPNRRARVLLGTAAVVLVVGVSASTSYVTWEDQPTWARMDRDKVSQAALAGAYLDRLGTPPEEPFVFIVDDRGPNPDAYVGLMTHMIRASLPAERLRALHIFVGDPADFLARRPSTDGTGQHTAVSRRFLEDLEPLLEARPIAFVAAALNDHSWGRWIGAHPDSRIGSDVAIVQGPQTGTLLDVPPIAIGPLPAYQWVAFAGGIACLYGLIGLGWTLAVFGGRIRRFEALALSPAVGLAAIVLAGVVADRLGVRLIGVPGAAVALAAGVAGWGALALRRRRAPLGTAPTEAA